MEDSEGFIILASIGLGIIALCSYHMWRLIKGWKAGKIRSGKRGSTVIHGGDVRQMHWKTVNKEEDPKAFKQLFTKKMTELLFGYGIGFLMLFIVTALLINPDFFVEY